MEDEYLTSFLEDFDDFFTYIWTGMKFVLGLGYIAGKFLTEAVVTSFYYILSLGSTITAVLEAIVFQIAEVVTEVLKSVLLIYHGIFKIVEAFTITFTDLVYFIGYMARTIGQLILGGLDFISESFFSLGLIPKYLYDGIVLFCDTFLICGTYALAMLHNFITQLIWTPIYAISQLILLCFKLGILIVNTLEDCYNKLWEIPLSVPLSILIFTAFYITYRRLSIWMVLKSCVNLIKRTYGVFGRAGKSLSTRLARYFKVPPKALALEGDTADTDTWEVDRSLRGMCVVCQDEPVCYISHPCCHVCLCTTCVHKLVKTDNRCPMCRNVVANFTRVYIS